MDGLSLDNKNLNGCFDCFLYHLVMTPVQAATQLPAPGKGSGPMANPAMAAIGGNQFPGSHTAEEATNEQLRGHGEDSDEKKLLDFA